MQELNSKLKEVKLTKLVHGAQAMGSLDDGRKVFVWNALPDEKVVANISKSKKDYAEGLAIEILESSSDRVEPKDELYLSTSPWQIMSYDAENKAKQQILIEVISREKLEYNQNIDFFWPKSEWLYRNKMEYSFYGDDDGLHLALFDRGTHRKRIVTSSSISRPEIDEVANKICDVLNKNNIRAGDLKSVILRCNQEGEVVASIFTKLENFKAIKELEGLCKGLIVVFSNPKSPASVRTKDIYSYGDITLSDEILGTKIKYDVFSFFQVNLEIFSKALEKINQEVGENKVIDIYSGVGTIGVCLKNPKKLIEIDSSNIFYAKENAFNKDSNIQVIQASSEKALEYINSGDFLIVDPPRAGLHKDLVTKILEVKPPKVIYLSCNPSTQARDLKMLETSYKIENISGYNFFPKTPHIESLAILVRK